MASPVEDHEEIKWGVVQMFEGAQQKINGPNSEEAVNEFLEVVQLHDALDESPEDKLNFRNRVVQHLIKAKRYTEAINVDRETLTRLELMQSTSEDLNTIRVRYSLASSYLELGKLTSAIVLLRKNESILEQLGEPLESCRTYARLAEALRKDHKLDESSNMETKWMSLSKRLLLEEGTTGDPLQSELNAGIIALAAHRIDTARSHFQKCLNMLRNECGDWDGQSDETFVCRLWLGKCRSSQHESLCPPAQQQKDASNGNIGRPSRAERLDSFMQPEATKNVPSNTPDVRNSELPSEVPSAALGLPPTLKNNAIHVGINSPGDIGTVSTTAQPPAPLDVSGRMPSPPLGM